MTHQYTFKHGGEERVFSKDMVLTQTQGQVLKLLTIQAQAILEREAPGVHGALEQALEDLRHSLNTLPDSAYQSANPTAFSTPVAYAQAVLVLLCSTDLGELSGHAALEQIIEHLLGYLTISTSKLAPIPKSHNYVHRSWFERWFGSGGYR